MKDLPAYVDVRDDTMREGLQIESREIPVDEKLRLLDALGDTGPVSYTHLTLPTICSV